jgi:hypothetical protein
MYNWALILPIRVLLIESACKALLCYHQRKQERKSSKIRYELLTLPLGNRPLTLNTFNIPLSSCAATGEAEVDT